MRVKEEANHPIQAPEMQVTNKELTNLLVVLAEELAEIRTKAARISQIEQMDQEAINREWLIRHSHTHVEQQIFKADQ
jgi:hypothetical protein